MRAAFAAVALTGPPGAGRTQPTVLVDAAHNPAGMAATVDAIKESFDFTRLVGVVACVSGKDVAGMLAALEEVCAELVVTQNSSPRAMPADELGALAVDVFGADRVSVSPQLAEALSEAIELAEAGPDDALGGSGVLVTGSVIHGRGGPHPDDVAPRRDRPRSGPRRGGRSAVPPPPSWCSRASRRCSCPCGIAQDGNGLTGAELTYLLVLAVVLILAAGHPAP